MKRCFRSRCIIFALAALFFSHPLNAEDYLQVKVRKGDTISYLSFKIYGRYDKQIAERLQKENPNVKDINYIYPGQQLRFPSPAAMSSIMKGDSETSSRPIGKTPASPLFPVQKQEPPTAMQVKAAKAVVTFLQGDVRIKKMQSPVWRPAEPNEILQEKDEVKLAAKSRAELILDSRTVMRLSENTHLTLHQLDAEPASRKKTTSLGLSLGRLWTKAAKALNPSSRFEVKTPTAIAGVQGTVYQVNVSDDEITKIKVYDGAVDVINPSQSKTPAGESKVMILSRPQPIQGPKPVSREEWTQIILRKYQEMTVKAGETPQPFSFNIDRERQSEWVRWNEERDRDIDSAAPSEETEGGAK